MPKYKKKPRSTGINEQGEGEREGVSEAGSHVRRAAEKRDKPPRVTGLWPGDMDEMSREEEELESARGIHADNLYELKKQKKPNIQGLAEGGEVDSATEVKPDRGFGKIIITGLSEGGMVDDQDTQGDEYEENRARPIKTTFDADVPADSPLRINTEMDAEGGEVGRSDDDELDDAMGSEFCDAIHKKDKGGIMKALHAISLSLKNRGK